MKKNICFYAIVTIGILIFSFCIMSKSGSAEKADIKALFEQKHARWKEFMNSPQSQMLSDSTGITTPYFKEIVKLGVPALPYIMEKMKQDPNLKVAVTEITKKWFTEDERKNNSIENLYISWWNEGYKQIPQQFEKLYGEWNNLKKQNKGKEAKEKFQEIEYLGIPALPSIVDKIEKGDNNLIPLVSYLTNNEIKENATAAECVAWWKANKDKWVLHQGPKKP